MFSLFFFPIPLIIFLFIFFLLRGSKKISFRPFSHWGEKNVTDVYGKPQEKEKDPEHAIFELAFRNKGRVTLSEIILETGLSMKKAEKLINSMLDDLRVRMEVDDKGLVYYEFPEIMDKFDS
jgi:hypothetical protein